MNSSSPVKPVSHTDALLVFPSRIPIRVVAVDASDSTLTSHLDEDTILLLLLSTAEENGEEEEPLPDATTGNSPMFSDVLRKLYIVTHIVVSFPSSSPDAAPTTATVPVFSSTSKPFTKTMPSTFFSVVFFI